VTHVVLPPVPVPDDGPRRWPTTAGPLPSLDDYDQRPSPPRYVRRNLRSAEELAE
jgi:hypothetical protein